MAKKTLEQLQEKAERERKKTKKFQARRHIKSQISSSRKVRREARFGTTFKAAKTVGRATVGLSSAAVTLAGQAARKAAANQRKARPKPRKKKAQPKSRNLFEEVYKGGF